MPGRSDGSEPTDAVARLKDSASQQEIEIDGEPSEALALPIEDVLDLHSFLPRDVPNVVRDYLDAAHDANLRRLRIIHGRGRGVQRKTVRALLERDPRVVDFGDAPLEAGGWGATWVTLQ